MQLGTNTLNWLKYQRELFLLSLSFFSRIPIPADTPYSDERMNRSGRYFALVGAVIGCLCSFVLYLCSFLVPIQIAILMMMVFSLLLTGAFHEDGLTDMADGIGGGMTVERRLLIMKDSRIGTYGAATLVMALVGKLLLLITIADLLSLQSEGYVPTFLMVTLIAAHTLSRTVAASLIFDMKYVSDADTSKSKPLANKQRAGELGFLIFCGLVSLMLFSLPIDDLSLAVAHGLKPELFMKPGLFMKPELFIVALIISAIIFRWWFKRWLISRIGGFTGDCLGAAQQLMELLIYFVIVAVLYQFTQ
ncbi:adenosylcobinamide-GDP ribazoletransferase [Vibrio sp. 03-59-1]|uniref:adenosylcobinamide-GDP ribazoletransferase n=1 Tax=Vibrio sp. 03-59-1 TaxID=2607607 RepID=UPI0014932D16|nr:adenosylcobinamide-GDP ribazoletransferase [Vibrio sp. 03-59-1]NOH84287.1 adenosylcobinamide-GDP ribazoletransferase [Vibrio sp. 03-59-1]